MNNDEVDYFVKRIAEYVEAKSSRFSTAVQVAVHRLIAQATPKVLLSAANNLSVSRVEARSSVLRHKRARVVVIGMNGETRERQGV